MNIEEIKKEFRNRDKLVRALSKDGHFRISAVRNTNTAETARKKHNLSAIQTYLLSHQLSAASMVASFLKGEERVILEAEGSGPIHRVFAEAMQLGEVRGFVELQDPYDEYKIEKLSDAIGIGVYKVTRILYNKNEPVTGIVELQKGDISSDLGYYYAKSEQVPTAVMLDVELNDDGMVNQSGGLMVQAMPGVEETQIKELYDNLTSLKPLTKYFIDGMDAEELLTVALPFEYDIIKTTPVDFYCRCSKDGFLSKLITLGTDELTEMRNDGHDELVCRYCNEKYRLTPEDFDMLISETKAQKN